MFAPAMFEDSLDGMCMILFPIILLACRFLLSETKVLFWLLHILVFVQAFAWVGIGQIIGYGRTMVIAAITAFGSAIVAGVVANFSTKPAGSSHEKLAIVSFTYSAAILFSGLSCLVCMDSLGRKGAFSTAWIISTIWICCSIGTVRNLIDRVYSRDVSRLTGIVLLDMYQLLLIEFIIQIFRATISCKIFVVLPHIIQRMYCCQSSRSTGKAAIKMPESYPSVQFVYFLYTHHHTKCGSRSNQFKTKSA